MSNNIVELTEQIIADLKSLVEIYKSMLALSLPCVEEMASLTDSPDDAQLAGKIKEALNDD